MSVLPAVCLYAPTHVHLVPKDVASLHMTARNQAWILEQELNALNH